jgi:hypothetical protein
MALKYSSKHDISYVNYNNKNIPWKLNSSYIYQNNQLTNTSLNIGTINNNLVIESSQNNIILNTSQNKKIIVKNNMDIANLDVSNNLNTKFNYVYDISLSNKLYFPSLPVNIIGDLKVFGTISVVNSASTGTGLAVSETQFTNVSLRTSELTDVSIIICEISNSYFYNNNNIYNSYIYNAPIGYDISNNISAPHKAIFSDISLENLILDISIKQTVGYELHCIPFASDLIAMLGYLHGDIERRNKE